MTNAIATKPDFTVMPPGLFRLALASTVFVSHIFPLDIGSACVYLFFMLSGYWIWVMWFKEYHLLEQRWSVFMVSRLWRLLPVYFTTLLLLVLCIWPLGLYHYAPPHGFNWPTIQFYIAQLTLLSHAQLADGDRMIANAWSLDIELQFYLVAPLVIWLLCARTARGPVRALLVAISIAGLAYFLRYLVPDVSAGTLPVYFGFFLVGLLSASCDWRPTRRQVRCSEIAIGLALLMFVAVPATRSIFLLGRFSGPLSDFNALGNLVLAFILAPYAMATVRQRQGKRDRLFGALSYEVYVVHGAAISVYFAATEYLSFARHLPYMVLLLAVTITLSLLIFRFVDQPAERLRRAYVGRQRRHAVAATATVAVVAAELPIGSLAGSPLGSPATSTSRPTSPRPTSDLTSDLTSEIADATGGSPRPATSPLTHGGLA
jgi:peptidoglycan/LPS O-acetylase OafA/YrhL